MERDGIKLTQCGQLGPYQDSVYAGTVTAESEEEARSKLAKMRFVGTILDRQDAENWHRPYFTRFAKSGEREWTFRIVQEYTG
jgi:hypothetical protein